MANCEISQDILYNCENPPLRGAKDRVIIIPHRIIDQINLNESNHLIVEDIDILSGFRAFEYVGDGTLIPPATTMIRDEFGVRYLHRLPFKVHGATPVIKKELEYLSKERDGVCIVLQQNYKGTSGNAEYLVMGKDAGMYVTLLTDEEGRNVFNIEIANQDGFEEPHMPANFFDTSTAVTKAKVDALTEIVSP